MNFNWIEKLLPKDFSKHLPIILICLSSAAIVLVFSNERFFPDIHKLTETWTWLKGVSGLFLFSISLPLCICYLYKKIKISIWSRQEEKKENEIISFSLSSLDVEERFWLLILNQFCPAGSEIADLLSVGEKFLEEKLNAEYHWKVREYICSGRRIFKVIHNLLNKKKILSDGLYGHSPTLTFISEIEYFHVPDKVRKKINSTMEFNENMRLFLEYFKKLEVETF